MRWSIVFCLLPLQLWAQQIFPSIGQWREHLPYQSSIDLAASAEKLYAATPYSLFSVDLATKEITRMSKVSGLSETGISTIQFDAAAGKLYIAYTNSNIDVLDARGMRNIPALKRENIAGDKSIYHIYPQNQRCYLATGLGVVVLDAEKAEVRESWRIGSNGGPVKTNAFAIHSQFFYAATDEGLKRVATSGANPANFSNWQTISGASGLPAGACRWVGSLQNQLVALQNDSLFVQNGNSWQLFFGNDFSTVHVNTAENKIFISQRKSNGASQVVVLNANGSVNRLLQQPGVISFPRNALSIGNQYWVADLFGGLSQWSGNSVEVYQPNSPAAIALGQLLVQQGTLYAAAGTVNAFWNYQYNRNGIMRLQDGQWKAFNGFRLPMLDSLLDFITVAVDPRDQTLWAGSYGGGLLHIKQSDALQVYKQNSSLEAAVGDPGSYRVSGLAFDAGNNLWVSNFGAARPLHVRKADGSWKAFTLPFALSNAALSQIVVDDGGQLWMASPQNGLVVFNNNESIDNSGDDRWRLLRAGAGFGNLPANDVQCLAKDRSGFIWVGTSNGVAVVQCPQEIFAASGGCDATLPIVQEGGFNNFLFKGQAVRSIAVDGADRKWMATADGVWLVSRDGDAILAHFTEENSALLSNDVKSVAIDGTTGEVFFGTASGIASYRGEATEATATAGSVLVFPNPVPPGYNGQIGIRGLPENSIVKIIETSGRLVYQTRSLGGQAIWNGRDYKGGTASSGVYLVIAVNDAKTEKVVAKIVFVNSPRP